MKITTMSLVAAFLLEYCLICKNASNLNIQLYPGMRQLILGAVVMLHSVL